MKRILALCLVLVATSLAAAPDPVTPTKPATPPTKPATTPAKPATTPAKPATTPPKPATTPAKPATTPAKPATTPAKPATTPAEAKKPVVEKAPEPDPLLFRAGDLLANQGLGSSLGVLSVTGYAEAEYGIYGLDLGGVPVLLGASAFVDGGYFSGETSSYKVTDTGFGVSALGTAHLGWRAVFPKVPVIKDLDSSLKIGAGYFQYGRSFVYSNGANANGGAKSGVGVSAVLGTSWYFLPSWALSLQASFLNYYSAAQLGVTYHF